MQVLCNEIINSKVSATRFGDFQPAEETNPQDTFNAYQAAFSANLLRLFRTFPTPDDCHVNVAKVFKANKHADENFCRENKQR